MNIGTANHVITRQIQNSNIPFKYQVNIPWNTLVGLPKAFQRKTNWKKLNKIYQTYLVSTTYSRPLESLLTNVTRQQIGQYSFTQNNPNILSKSNNSATDYQINKFNALLPASHTLLSKGKPTEKNWIKYIKPIWCPQQWDSCSWLT